MGIFRNFVRWLGRRNAFFWVVLAGLTAHLGALWSDYYMDDYGFVVQADQKSRVPWHMDFMGLHFQGGDGSAIHENSIAITQLLSTLAFDGIHALLAPWKDPKMLSMGFHAANLLVHLLAACLVLAVMRRLLASFPLFSSQDRNRLTATATAVIFAIHPLGTEPVNYAKCLMLEMVVAFGLLMLLRFLIQLERPSFQNAAWWALAFAGTLLSYFPGAIVAFGGMVLVLLANWRSLASRLSRKQLILTLAVPVLLALAVGPFFVKYIHIQLASTTWDHRVSHMLTQGRVFWLYLGKVLIPTNLCSDHFIPWSVSTGDTVAVLATIAALGLASIVYGTLVLSRNLRRRSWALAAAMAITPLLYRFLYVNHDAMVEYRIYPALPWLALLLGGGIAVVLSLRRRAFHFAVGCAAAACLLLSIFRSLEWHEHATHCERDLQQYPLNNRARVELVSQAFSSLDWESVPGLVKDVRSAKSKIDAYNQSHPSRAYSTYLTTLPLIYLENYYSLYLATTEGPDAGLRQADHAISSLRGIRAFAAFNGNPQQTMGLRPLLAARDNIAKNREQLTAAAKIWQEFKSHQQPKQPAAGN